MNKFIKENETKFKNPDNLSDFVDSYINEDRKLTDIEEYISEYVNGLVPIYYVDIIREWTENSDAHGLTVEMQGSYGDETDIYKMMMLDLFYHYEQDLAEDYQKLIELYEQRTNQRPHN